MTRLRISEEFFASLHAAVCQQLDGTYVTPKVCRRHVNECRALQCKKGLTPHTLTCMQHALEAAPRHLRRVQYLQVGYHIVSEAYRWLPASTESLMLVDRDAEAIAVPGWEVLRHLQVERGLQGLDYMLEHPFQLMVDQLILSRELSVAYPEVRSFVHRVRSPHVQCITDATHFYPRRN